MNTPCYTIVVGLGKTGFACLRYLVEQGNNVAVIDNRECPPYLEKMRERYPNVPYSLGSFASPLLAKAHELVVSPGVSLKEPALAECIALGVPVIGDIELFARQAHAPIIAVTGANGKSTVTTLVGLMAEAAGINVKVGGNLGVPALELLDKQAELYVLELSSFQLETTYSLCPAVAVVLNITPDHLDRYHDFTEYCQAKWRIYNECKTAIVNRDDPVSYKGVILPKQVISFGLDKPSVGNFGYSDGTLFYGNKKLLKINELRIRGCHQVANALAALAIGKALGLSVEIMVMVLKSFPGLEHRCQWVREINQVNWFNDSKGTNVGATQASVVGLGQEISGKVVLILGGQGKGADFTLLRAACSQYVRAAILLGQDAALIKQAILGCCRISEAFSMADAVLKAKEEAQPGDVVLLSPACASFDMFNNFEHRGQVFVEEVQKIGAGL